jgi:hypothetical protein
VNATKTLSSAAVTTHRQSGIRRRRDVDAGGAGAQLSAAKTHNRDSPQKHESTNRTTHGKVILYQADFLSHELLSRADQFVLYTLRRFRMAAAIRRVLMGTHYLSPIVSASAPL